MADLERFIEMHKIHYDKALKEIKNGKKRTCWIWYILPIMKGLRNSKNSQYYGIKNFEEAIQYLSNEYLRLHLIEMCKAILDLGNIDISEVMGYIDDEKLKQCMTLFNKVEQEKKIDCKNIFKEVLSKYYNGEEDQKTLKILETLSKK